MAMAMNERMPEAIQNHLNAKGGVGGMTKRRGLRLPAPSGLPIRYPFLIYILPAKLKVMHFSRSMAHAITKIVLSTFIPVADIKSSLSAADAIC
ncbi:hypothetical protein N7481_003603 [Penicillium waksmanii]|uniref:uncharacterized protein n=1 Tax=Penicillium waksmanii TaxID=69791 RepID=UPI002548C8EF|nr:uncharacterized protein N7481_003603 [Penicillium waksmanii]KAJ5988393.1 hypothetical protein N7481_003603 [Penicillium waksmanii]